MIATHLLVCFLNGPLLEVFLLVVFCVSMELHDRFGVDEIPADNKSE